MKKVLSILIIAISIVFTSCKQTEVYSFLKPTDEVFEIAIVALSFDNAENLIETEIKKIEDISAFLEDFKKLDCYACWGDPAGVTPEGVEDTVIKISYANGEYELINWNGQSEFTSEKGFKYYAGYSIFDEQQFESLIESACADQKNSGQ